MEFEFDEGQRSFRETVGALLADEMSPGRIREVWDQDHAYDHGLWRKLAELGVLGVAIEEQHGGFGGDLVDLALVLEACGYHAATEPVVEGAVVAPTVLARWADSSLQERWLPRLVAGEALISVALHPDACVVPDGLTADAVLVRDGDRVHLVERSAYSASGLVGSDPSRRLAECTFELDDSTLLSADPRSASDLFTLGAAATANALVGLSQRMLDMTRDYVLTREQFGRVIGSFQAVKHRLADVAVQIESARSLAWYAMYAQAHAPEEAATAARIAKSRANEAAAAAGSAALQLHGGIGFTWEHDLHLWLQRGRAWEFAFGTTTELRRFTGRELLGAV